MELLACTEEGEGRDSLESRGESVVIRDNVLLADGIEEREAEIWGLGSSERMEERIEEREVGGGEEANNRRQAEDLEEMGGGRDSTGVEEEPFRVRVRVRVCESGKGFKEKTLGI